MGEHVNHDTREQLIGQYANGYDIIVEALRDITAEEMDAREAPSEWSPREVIHHLADSEMTSAMRLRLLLVEDNPPIRGYDEAAFARRLWYDRPVELSLDAFRLARATTVQILARMSDADWQRSAIHSESGRFSATDWLESYAAHAPEHADQIRRARATVTAGVSTTRAS